MPDIPKNKDIKVTLKASYPDHDFGLRVDGYHLMPGDVLWLSQANLDAAPGLAASKHVKIEKLKEVTAKKRGSTSESKTAGAANAKKGGKAKT